MSGHARRDPEAIVDLSLLKIRTFFAGVVGSFLFQKTKTPDVQTLAAANAKREATRAARGTKGTQQRKAVKGAVTGVAITPIVAAAPVVTAAPATPSPASNGSATSGGAPRTA